MIFKPSYTLPSRTHFTKLTEEKYEIAVSEIKDALQLNKNKTNFCLTTMPLEEHTGPKIAAWIEEDVARFEIPASKIVAVVHDNGPGCKHFRRKACVDVNVLCRSHFAVVDQSCSKTPSDHKSTGSSKVPCRALKKN